MRAVREFDGSPADVSSARAFVAATLSAWDLDDLAEVAVLLTSEIVTNAVRYAPGPVSVAVADADGAHAGAGAAEAVIVEALVVEVGDTSTRPPAVRPAGPDDEGGRGIRMLSTLASRWGWHPARAGKVVWFSLRR